MFLNTFFFRDFFFIVTVRRPALLRRVLPYLQYCRCEKPRGSEQLMLRLYFNDHITATLRLGLPLYIIHHIQLLHLYNLYDVNSYPT